MPAMLRPSKKARKIAEKLLGVPDNMRKQPKRIRKQDKIVAYQNTMLMR